MRRPITTDKAPDLSVNRAACKLHLQRPSALPAPAAGYRERRQQ